MKLICVSVRDLATETFARPFFVAHAGQAMRSFMDEANNPESEISRHAKDYELWDLGSWDDQSATFTGSQPVRIARAIDLVKG